MPDQSDSPSVAQTATMVLLHKIAGIKGARKEAIQILLETSPLEEIEEALVTWEAQLLAAGVDVPFHFDLKFKLEKPDLYSDILDLPDPHTNPAPLRLVEPHPDKEGDPT